MKLDSNFTPWDGSRFTELQNHLIEVLFRYRGNGISTLDLGEHHFIAPLNMLRGLRAKGFEFLVFKKDVIDQRGCKRRRVAHIKMIGCPSDLR